MKLFKFSLLCLFGLHLYSKRRGSDNNGKWIIISCSRCGCRLTMYEPHEPPKPKRLYVCAPYEPPKPPTAPPSVPQPYKHKGYYK